MKKSEFPDRLHSARNDGPTRRLPTVRLTSVLVFLVVAALLGGCNWVDSTGVQNNAPSIVLDEGQVIVLSEGVSRSLDPIELVGDQPFESWRWGDLPIQEGDLPGCATAEGYSSTYAADSVEGACYDSGSCNLYFAARQIDAVGGNRTVFDLNTPVLRAPVGVTYQLFGNNTDGVESEKNFTFCLISINDPPDAMNDAFTVIEGETLHVGGAGVLANDADDVDVSNFPRSVQVPAKREPARASHFELYADGTFSYTPDPMLILPSVGGLSDSFEYEMTDGTWTVSATAIINIVKDDHPPELLEPIPGYHSVVGIETTVSLSEYFGDPEGSDLSFSLIQSTLPLSGNFSLTTVGELTGSASRTDIGTWQIRVTATDGNHSITAEFPLTIVDNNVPAAESVPAQGVDVDENFSFEAADYFSDPEGIGLFYSLAGVDSNILVIDRRTGLITGVFRSSGVFELLVSASDGVNEPVSATIIVNVADHPNRPPVYTGIIGNQNVTLGSPIQDIQGNFSDADNDTLSFSMQGTLPTGVVLNPVTGVVSGTPTVEGTFVNLRIVATDSLDTRAVSDTFTLTVVSVQLNLKPVYEGRIANQTITLGSAIHPIEGNFSDPEGGDLTFSIVGELPVGLLLSADGVLTGKPTATSRNLKIRATDPQGASVSSDLFRIIVVLAPPVSVNRKPEFFGSIPDHLAQINIAISPISGRFEDPDGDPLRYLVHGNLPAGLSIDSSSGVISGIATESGIFSGLQIQATDTGNLSQTSDTFAVTVTEPNDNLQEIDGLVAFHATQYNTKSSAAGHAWQEVTSNLITGDTMMQSVPDTGTIQRFVADSPSLDYAIDFEAAGTAYVWLHGRAIPKGNSLHIGLNGVNPLSGRSMNFKLNRWSWSNNSDGGVASIEIPSAGSHTLNIWMREDGMAFDEIRLSRDPNYQP